MVSENETTLQNGTQCSNIQYSIFQGVRPIIVFQHIEKKDKIRDTLCNSKEVEQFYYIKYQVFMKLAKRLIFTNRKRYFLSFLRFKRLCIFDNFEQYLTLNKNLPLKYIQLDKLLNGIIRLYPHIKITIINEIKVDSIVNNKQLLSTLLIGVLEKILSNEVTIILKSQFERQISLTLRSYFNDNNFQNIKQIAKLYRSLITELILDSFSITMIITDNDFSRKAKISDQTQELLTSNLGCFNQESQRGLTREVQEVVKHDEI